MNSCAAAETVNAAAKSAVIDARIAAERTRMRRGLDPAGARTCGGRSGEVSVLIEGPSDSFVRCEDGAYQRPSRGALSMAGCEPCASRVMKPTRRARRSGIFRQT